jgi:hypothetical protein
LLRNILLHSHFDFKLKASKSLSIQTPSHPLARLGLAYKVTKNSKKDHGADIQNVDTGKHYG